MKDKKAFIRKLASLIGLLLLVIYFSVTNDYFFTVNNLMTVGLQTSTIAYIGMGVTCVILTGGIDLSIGSVSALAAVVAGLVMTKFGMSSGVGIIIGLLAGAICGALNGLFIIRLKLPPFIATLGMMMIARGAALYITNASPVSNLPDAFAQLGNGALFRTMKNGPIGPMIDFPGIPYPIIIMIILILVFTFILTKLRLGRYLYAIGSNEEAARLSGVNVNRVKMIAYIFSGVMAGLCGLVIAARLVTAQPSGGINYELDAIASAVVGGTSLMGGVGTIPGTIIGSFVIGVLRNGLNMNGVSAFVQQILIGAVIIFTVSLDQLRNKGGGSKKAIAKKQINHPKGK